MKKKEIELVIVQALKRLKDYIKIETSQRANYLFVSEETLTTIKIEDVDKDSKFSFFLEDLELNSAEPLFTIERNPMNPKCLDSITEKLRENVVKERFIQWIQIVNDYNEINLSTKDEILNAYIDEFYTDFEIIDDDSSTKPFNFQQQIYLDKFLDSIIYSLDQHKDNEEIRPLIEETKEIKERLTKETKKKIINRISKLISKVRIIGLKLFNEIINEAKKELIKRIITGSLDGIDNLI